MLFLKYALQRRAFVWMTVFATMQTLSLTAQSDCPDIQINFSVPAVVCFDANNNIVDLEVEINGSAGTGTGQWSGDHITNTTTGFFRTTFATPGQQKVYFTYTEETCIYQDSTTFLYARPSPIAFLASSEQAGHLCQDSFSILNVLTDYDSTTTNLIWDFNGGVAEEQGNPDSLHLFWEEPGSKLIQLQAEQFGCLSQPIIQQVILDPVIDTPVVACDNTLGSVVYEWEDPPNSSATIVFVISGPNGVADTVEDRYTIDNLLPGQIVQVRMVTTSKNTCDGNFIDPICRSITCDADLIDINPIENVCISNGMTDTLDLDYILYDTLTPATLTWSGAGIFDPDQARIVIDPAMAGQLQWVYVEFQSENCTVRDSVSFELIPPPIVDFSLPATTCPEEITLAEFIAAPLSPDSDTTLLWDFGDATVEGDPSEGLADLSWADSGLKEVGLAIQRGACRSDTTYRTIDVQAVSETAQINCTPGPNSVLFTWQDIPGTTFDIQVLEGPAGIRLSATSYEITGLSTNQNASIEVTTTSAAGNCGPGISTASCLPIDCASVSISIEDIPPVCLPSDPGPISLQATVDGGDGTGILNWRGPNVSGNSWAPDSTLAGRTLFLHAEYQEGLCIYEDSIEVNVSEFLSADFQLDTVVCLGDSIDLTFTGQASAETVFDWQPDDLSGIGPHTLVFDQAGTQRIGLILEENACSSELVEKTIEVLAPYPSPVISCSGGLNEVVFSWTPADVMRQEIIYNGPGTGTLTSDTSFLISGLLPETAVDIEVQFIDDDFPCRNISAQADCNTSSCDELSLNWTAPTTVCQGEALPVSFAAQGAGPEGFDLTIRQGTATTIHPGISDGNTLTFDLNDGATFTLLSAEAPGGNSCTIPLPDPLTVMIDTSREAGSQVNFPAICAGSDTTIRLADLLEGAAPGGQWSYVSGGDEPADAFNADDGTFAPRQSGAGLYRFQYRVAATNSCPSDSTLLEVDLLEAPIADAGPDQSLDCRFNVASLGSNQISPNMIYRWNGPSAGAIADPVAPITEVTLAGKYTLTVEDPSNSCTAIDEVTITASPDVITLYARAIPISCYGDRDGMIVVDSIIGGEAPYLFSLNGSDQENQSVFSNLSAGNYDLQVNSSDGCRATVFLTIAPPVELSVQLAAENKVINAGDSVQLTALVNIPVDQIAQTVWLPDPVSNSEPALTQMVSPKITSSYGVEITDVRGCTADDRVSIVVQTLHKTYIPNAFSPNEDGHNDVFFVQAGPGVQRIRYFSIYDRWGKQLFVNQGFQPNDPAEGWNGNARSLPQPPGVYIYQAEVELADGESIILSGDVALLR